MNPFSFILIGIIGYCFIKAKNTKQLFFYIMVLTVLTELYLEVGYFVKIGQSKIGYRAITEVLLLLVACYSIIKYRIAEKILLKGLILLISILTGIFNLIINPCYLWTGNINVTWDDMLSKNKDFEQVHFTSFMIGESARVIIFIIAAIAIYSIFNKDDYKKFLLLISKYIRWILYIGIIEFVTKYILKMNIFNTACNWLFGISEATYLTLTERGSGYVLQGLTQEASHYAYSLTLTIIVLWAVYELTHKGLPWIIIAIILMICSMSFSSSLFITGIIILYCIYWIKKSKNIKSKWIKWIIFSMFFLIATAIIIVNASNIAFNMSETSFWGRRIRSLVEESKLVVSGDWAYATESLEWSNRVRLLSSYYTLKLIVYRPLFGLGFGAVTSHGSTTMLLAGTGIIGTFIWINFTFFSFYSLINQTDKWCYKASVLIWIIVNLLNSMGLRPFYEMTTITMMIALSFIFVSNKSINSLNVDTKLENSFI